MRRFLSIALALLTVWGMLVALSVRPATAAERTPYVFSLDIAGEDPDKRVSGDKLGVLRGLSVSHGGDLRLAGWFSTPDGVAGYEYICVPVGGGAASWAEVPRGKIFDRPDLTPAQVPYPTGHKTAGFDLTIPMTRLDEGYYDVYLRARSTAGTTFDFLALLRVRYGSPDVDDGATRTVSFDRLVREGAASIVGGTTVTAKGIRLSPGGAVRLGNLHLPGMERVVIRYTTEAAVESGERRAFLGLKSSGDHPYGTLGEGCDMTDSLTYAALPRQTDGEMAIDITEIGYSGDVWLSGSLAGEITVTEIIFYYNGKGTDRVAAKLYLSGDTAKYLSGQNAVSCVGINDSTVGDCLRVEVSQDTNDPFVHFSAGLMLEDDGLRLDADEYQYLVLLLRAAPYNQSDHMTLYLCAGVITGATEACTKSFTLTRDGRWHYYLLDLTSTENWTGIVNGWRFDIINGNCAEGNTVDIASVQFFRTASAAKAAAEVKPSQAGTYKLGDPAVIHDLCEEAEADEGYVVPPEDTVVDTTPDTQPPEGPETRPVPVETGETVTLPGAPAETEVPTAPPKTDAEMPSGAETEPPRGGCASVLRPGGALVLSTSVAGAACAGVGAIRIKKNTKRKRL